MIDTGHCVLGHFVKGVCIYLVFVLVLGLLEHNCPWGQTTLEGRGLFTRSGRARSFEIYSYRLQFLFVCFLTGVVKSR